MRRLVSFALDGAVELPAQAPPGYPEPLVSKDFRVDATLVTEGQESYVRLCWRCHGPAGVSGGTAPDLRASPVLLSKEAYLDVVLRGSRQDKGMPGFPNLDEAGAEAVQHYVRSLVPENGKGN